VTSVIARLEFRKLLLGLVCGLASLLAIAGDTCRVAFDMGSSGIRAGASNSEIMVRTEFDYLSEWWYKHSLKGAIDSTVTALRNLPQEAGFATDCQKVGGGFSAWRLAAEGNIGELTGILEQIHSETGVAILIVPQQQEGAYGFFGSRNVLGMQLTTTHVLDIGGGSLQISGEKGSFGDALGQKVWHRELCRVIRNTDATPCTLQPLTKTEVATARALVADRLRRVTENISGPVTLTSISRPVSRNIFPSIKRLVADGVGHEGFSRSAITQAIDHLALLTLSDTTSLSGNGATYAAYLISDMLLVEAVLQATGATYLTVAEIDLSNIPGLLNDERAFSWAQRYDCYLERLRSAGIPAFASDPVSCQQ
jgi:hypothetical protein